MSALLPPAVDEVGLVHGPAADAALVTAAEQLGGELVQASLRAVDHRPGAGVTAVHDVVVRTAEGRRASHVLALTTDVAAVQGSTGTLVLASGGARLGVWRLPHDPALPGLLPAMDPGAVAHLLTSCGVATDPRDVRLRLRAYRPRRRAVVEAQAPGATIFLKVVPPVEAVRLHHRHRELVAAGVPAPRSLGTDPRGVVVLDRLPGRTWRRVMLTGGASPPVAQLWQAMDRMPAGLLDAARRASWAEQSGHHVAVLQAACPGSATLVADLAGAADVSAQVAGLPTVPVHGDLYEAQLTVADGRLCGILDLDAAGPGHRVDDEACLLAHLVMLPLAHPVATSACAQAVQQHMAVSRTDPELLWRRSALVMLTLATGPLRNRRDGWQRRTERWLQVPRAALQLLEQRPGHRWPGPDLLRRLLSIADGTVANEVLPR